MRVLIQIPDDKADEFLRKFVPSGVIDRSEEFPVMEMLPVIIEKVDTPLL